MFDQILQLVKEQLSGNPEVAKAIPSAQADEIHKEIASHVSDNLTKEAVSGGGIGGLLSKFTGGIDPSNPLASSITGGLAGTLAKKFNLPPAAIGAISAAIPGLLQKFAHKASDPSDNSITIDSLTKSLPGGIGGALGKMFG